ncbi:uncharacterized protein LOC105221446 isoform X2 [Zeugodacus cucurbitae]|uniref:uncharacterized protein LOC105221446 isoform X2 n=1 Tax=Zeugodacus cucurbitae TaxID=28588 RepID=UPI0023D94BFD|nr:uncharacterized protein LOC105221446 isoform X2 [Zeugodacus cucurbitae]
MTESEDDDNASISSSILIEGNWEDNWLFRKKRPSITTSMTGSIGMLIPAPKDDVRAQIGDKTTDEISDLSEMESDTDDSSLKIYSSLDPRSDRILNKHLIGGQNTKGILDELIETASLVSNTSLPRSESNYFETMNEHVLEVASKTEAFNSCIASNSPQEEEIKLKSKPKNYYEDHLTPETENNSLSAPFQTTESIHVGDSCTGFSSVENVLSHDTRSICPGASVIEILAAITLGPLLAVSASEQPSIQAPFEISSLKDLSDIALTEIKSRAQELRHHSLDVIDEEEESKIMNSLNEIFSQNGVELADIKTDTTSPHINDTIRKLIDEKSLQSEGKPSLAVRHHRITYYTDEVPSESRSDTEQEAGFVMDKDSANQTPSSKQKECNHETETPYTYDTDKREYSSEEKEGIVMDKEAPELSAIEREKQTSYIEPEGEFIMNNESENGISFSVQKEECGYDEGDNESNSGKKRDGVMDTEIFTMEREKQNPYNVADAESENRTPFSDNYSGNYTKATEISKIADIFATENLEAISEFHLNRVVDTDAKAINTETSNISYIVDTDKHESNSGEKEDSFVATEAVEDSEPQREKQMPSNQPKTERPADRESENRITFSGPKDECANDSETNEFSETSYISATENLEHFMELNRDRVIETTALELIVTNSKTQEASETKYTSYTEKHEYSSEGKENSGIDEGALEFSTVENEKQTSYNEPKGVFITDTKCENEVTYSKPTDQSANVNEAHKASQTPVVYEAGYVMEIESANRIPSSKQKECPYKTETNRSTERAVTSDTGTQESNSETKEDIGRNKGVQKFSATESEKHTPRTAPEGEFIMNIESEKSMQKEECAYDIEDHESSSENKGDSVMDTESAEIFTMESEKQHPSNVADAEGDNRTPSNYAKKECGKNTKATESSEIADIFATENLETISESNLDRVMDTAIIEVFAVNTEASNTSYTADADKHESNSEQTEDNIVATEAVEYSEPQREKQMPSNQPETERAADREGENRITFSGPKDECANDSETKEFSETSYISATENLEHFMELNRDRVIETTALELIVTNSKTQEASETPYTSYTDKHEYSREGNGNSGIDKGALEFSTVENEKQTSYNEPKGVFITDTKCENEVTYSKQTDQNANVKEAHKASETPVVYEAGYVMEIESANRIPSSKQKECPYKTETNRSAETAVTSDTDTKESNSETKEDIGSNKGVQKFSGTESEKHTLRTAPEGEFIMNIESENEIYFSMQKEECAYDIEDHESSSENNGDSVMDTESAEIVTMESEKQHPSNVADAEGDNRTPSNYAKKECGKNTKATESSEIAGIFATENLESISKSHLDRVMDTDAKELSAVNTEASNISYNADTDKHESNNEGKEDNTVATEAVEDSTPQSEKPNPSKQPETECITDRERVNRILFSGPKEECLNDTEAREFSVTSYISESEDPEHFKELNQDRVIETAALEVIVAKTKAHEETPYTSDIDKHEFSSEEKGNSGIDKEALKLSVTENGNQTPWSKSEVEFITDTKSETEVPYSKQTDQSAYDSEAHKISETRFAYDTESGAEYIIEIESANRIPSSKQKECHYETETHKTSETTVISDADNQESSSETKEEDKEVQEFSATESEKHTPHSVSEGEFIMNIESENEIYFSMQKDECAYDIEDHESSSEDKGDSVMDTESAEIFTMENEKQNPYNVADAEGDYRTPSNDPKKECGKTTKATKSSETAGIFATENLKTISESHLDRVMDTASKELFAVNMETSNTSYTGDTEKHESISEKKVDNIVATETVEDSAPQSEKPKPSKQPETECLTYRESENRILLSGTVKECDHDTEDREFSVTSYISESENPEHFKKLNRDRVIETAALELIVTKTKAHEVSETTFNSDTEKHEYSSEEKGNSGITKKALEFSGTENKKQTTCTEPEREFITDTKSENGIAFSIQQEECAYDDEDHESSSEDKGDMVMDTESAVTSIMESEKQKPCNVSNAESDNRTPSCDPQKECDTYTRATEPLEISDLSATENLQTIESQLDRVRNTPTIELFVINTEDSKPSYPADTDKHESNSEGKEDNIVATEAVENSASQHEKQMPSNEAETKCVMNRESEIRVPFNGQKEECGNDTEARSPETSYVSATENLELSKELNLDRVIEITVPIVTNPKEQEVPETPNTLGTDKHEYSSGGNGNSGITKKALEFSATENKKQTTCAEPEGEFITDTKSENIISLSMQKEECAYDVEDHESSSEDKRKNVMDTESAEILTTESRKQNSSNVVDAEGNNRIPSNYPKKEWVKNTKATEYSETAGIFVTENLETISESHLDRVMDTAANEVFAVNTEASNTSYTADAVKHESNSEQTEDNIVATEAIEDSASQREKPKRSKQPETECVTDRENENLILFSGPKDEWVNDTEARELSVTSYISTTKNPEHFKELNLDRVIEIAVPIVTNIKAQEASEAPNNSGTDKHQSNSEGKEDNIVATEAVEDSAPQREKPKPSNQPEENENRIIVTKTKAHEVSETPYSSDTDKHEYSREGKGNSGIDKEALEFCATENQEQPSWSKSEGEFITDTKSKNEVPYNKQTDQSAYEAEAHKASETRVVYDTKPGAGCVMEIESANRIPSSKQKECPYETETNKSSETPVTSGKESQETSSETKEDIVRDKTVQEFSATESEKHTPCSAPEGEFVMNTEREKEIYFSMQREECAYDVEDHKSSSEDKGESVIDTESAEISIMDCEKKKPCNVSNAESDNRTPSSDPRKECGTYTRATESLEISDISAIENIVTIESQLDRVMNTATVELFVINIEDSKTSYTADTDKYECNSEEKEDNIVATEAGENSAPQRKKQMPSNEAETKYVMNKESENRIPFNGPIEECDNETEASKSTETSYISATENLEHSKELNLDRVIEIAVPIVTNTKSQEASEAPNTSDSDIHEYISEGKGDSGVDKEALEYSATESQKQTSCTEPEGECIMDANNDNGLSFSKQEATEREKQTEQEIMGESIEDNIMDTKVADFLETKNEGQMPGEECFINKETESRPPCNNSEEEYDNVAEVPESSHETQYACGSEEQEHISNVNKNLASRTPVEFSATVLLTTEDCVNEAEAQQSSETPYICDTVIQESNSDINEKNNVNSNEEELSATETEEQKNSTETEAGYDMETKTENLIPVREKKKDFNNYAEVQKHSETHYSKESNRNNIVCVEPLEFSATDSEARESSDPIYYSDTYKHECNCEANEDNIMATIAVVISATESKKQKSRNNPEDECAIETEGSIAEREYKKWNNAVEMPNNPYSPEALERRISGSQERFIDLPNINSSTNKNVITITETTKAEEDSENEHRSDIGYKSRDYYINADNTPKVSPKYQIHRNDRRKRLSSGCSDEHIADTGTKECISQVNETIAIKNPNVIHPTVYLALPVQVVEESTSFETLSNQPMQSVDTTNSDDSDTIRIYDFKNQTTVVVHNEGKPLTGTDTTAIKFRQKTVEPFQDTATNFTPIKYTCKVSCQKADVSTPTLGPTPNAFKFLQPKRRIIDPSQMLPLNEEAQVLSFGEKSVVEEEVAQVMPSVKALAQAFLLSSNKCSQAEKRWKKGIQKMPSTSIQFSNPPETYTENIVKVPEKTEDTTISSDLSSLETDPSINVDISTNKTSRSPSTERTVNNEENNNKNTTNMLRRVSMLKSNIAFFENLKFK